MPPLSLVESAKGEKSGRNQITPNCRQAGIYSSLRISYKPGIVRQNTKFLFFQGSLIFKGSYKFTPGIPDTAYKCQPKYVKSSLLGPRCRTISSQLNGSHLKKTVIRCASREKKSQGLVLQIPKLCILFSHCTKHTEYVLSVLAICNQFWIARTIEIPSS